MRDACRCAAGRPKHHRFEVRASVVTDLPPAFTCRALWVGRCRTATTGEVTARALPNSPLRRGPDALTYLQGLVTSDVRLLAAPHAAQLCAFLDSKGRTLAEATLCGGAGNAVAGAPTVLVDCSAGAADTLLVHVTKRLPIDPANLEKEKSNILPMLESQRTDGLLSEWVERQRAAAGLEFVQP